ncbi:hypothetical protein U5801_23630 [Lamprobacter modestohalophilus]|uniref:hypothetical protein n=1 Tax=Lamprobacter modestohalophilus TaxID=1064514 RepID=UPI002ADEE458|nr:hypothetical protein [Lamprobacter modestohalophilus]MEA1052777.1 hypothetical protein [Lamprobacter modestohalophilus]
MTHSSTNDKAAHQTQKIPCRIPKVSLAAATLALALSATATLATPSLTINNMQSVGSVDLRFPDKIKDVFSTGYDEVTISSRYFYGLGDSSIYQEEEDVWAGAFGGEAQRVVDASGNPDPFDPTTLYRSQDEVILYCLDIFNDLQYASSFVRYNVFEFDNNEETKPTTTTEIIKNKEITVGWGRWRRPITIPGLTVTGNLNNVLHFLGAVNDVLENTNDYGTYNFGDRNWLNPADRWVSGAIQVGIWESLYDDEMNLDTGHFSVEGLSEAGADLLDNAFDQMANSNPLDRSLVLLFQPVNGGQTLIGDPDPVDVPAPGTLVLLLSGLFLVRKVSRISR